MKHDWEYKKLGEIGTIITGNTPPTSNPKNYESRDICFVKPSDIGKEGIASISRTEYYISNYAYNNSCRKLPQGSVLTTCIGIIGKVGILENDATCNQQINAFVPKDELLPRYAAYALLAIRDLMQSVANAPVVPILNKGQFSSFLIPVPPLPIQQQIVAELDKVSEIIEKKKQQVKELDNLAQSIFYDMFGDPVENEKGWEVKKLEDIVHKDCPISYGIVQPGDDVECGVPVVRPIDMTDTFVKSTGLKKTTVEISNSYKRTVLKGNEILMCVRGTTGLVSLATQELVGANVTRGITPIECNDNNNRWFVYFQIKSKGIQDYIANYTKGIALKQINMKDVREIPLILPPLPLQQSFAQKIEVIEKQKELITASIKEAQTLFDARMDYWFGE